MQESFSKLLEHLVGKMELNSGTTVLKMSASIDMRQKAIALIEQLSTEKLTAVVQLMEFLTEPSQQLITTSEEHRLLQVIQRQLPVGEQQRLQELRDRCEWGELAEAEHQELIHCEDHLEQQNVERLEALLELAKLRHIDVLTLNHQLHSEPQPFHAA